MKWLMIEKHPDGRRFYIFGHRIHHLEAGLVLILIGWVLVLHDWFFHERRKVEEQDRPMN